MVRLLCLLRSWSTSSWKLCWNIHKTGGWLETATMTLSRANSAWAALMAFNNGVTALMNKERTTVIICQYFCKAFDVVLHNILDTKLERFGFDKWAVRCRRNLLSGHIQRVTFNVSTSKWKPMRSSVSQGSILGPILFAIFRNDIVGSSAPSASLQVFILLHQCSYFWEKGYYLRRPSGMNLRKPHERHPPPWQGGQ